jgi:hypothetical protein
MWVASGSSISTKSNVRCTSSGDDIARVVFLVSLTSCVIWALCTALKKAMHAMADGLLGFVGSHGPWLGPVTLLAALVAGGLACSIAGQAGATRPATASIGRWLAESATCSRCG